jgi:hypothetical protein
MPTNAFVVSFFFSPPMSRGGGGLREYPKMVTY